MIVPDQPITDGTEHETNRETLTTPLSIKVNDEAVGVLNALGFKFDVHSIESMTNKGGNENLSTVKTYS